LLKAFLPCPQLCDHANGARYGRVHVRISVMSVDEPSDRGIAAAVAEIDGASNEAMLLAGVKGARQAVAAELGRHTPTLAVAAGWSEAMRTTVATAARLVAGGESPRWTWFVSGSVGRGEAVPGSDVETLIALADDVDDAGKTHALTLAAEVHTLLEQCGLPLDDNGVLASRLRFCRRDVSWTDGIERWAADPEHDRGVVMLGLLADAWSVTLTERGERLRPHALAAAQRHPIARKSMLQDATWARSGIPSRLRIPGQASRPGRPQGRRHRPDRQDRPLGGLVGGLGGLDHHGTAQRRRGGKGPRHRRRVDPAGLLRRAVADPVAHQNRAVAGRRARRRHRLDVGTAAPGACHPAHRRSRGQRDPPQTELPGFDP